MNIHDKRPKAKILEKFISAHFFKPKNELLAFDVASQIEVPVTEHDIRFGKVSLNGWHIENKNPKGQIIFFHGSTGTNHSWKLLFYYLFQSGYSIWSFDYAGYGKSSDMTSFSTFYYDVEKIYTYITELTGNKIDDFILYGHSLGCFAVQHLYMQLGEPKKIIMQSPLFSLDVLLRGKSPSFLLNYFKIHHYSLENLYHSETLCHILVGDQDLLLPKGYGIELWKDRDNTNLIVFQNYKHASFIKPDAKLLDKIF